MNICKSILGLTSKTVNLFQDDTLAPSLKKEGNKNPIVAALQIVILLYAAIILTPTSKTAPYNSF